MKYDKEKQTLELAIDWRTWLKYALAMLAAYAYGNGGLPPLPIFQQPPIQQPPLPPPLQPAPPPPVPIGPPAPPVVPDGPKADPIGAIVKIRSGNSGCTGIHLGDILKSGHSYWLTAAHCTGGIGSNITVIMQTGGSVTATVVKRDSTNDISIARSPAKADYPFAVLASDLPDKGTPVWHRGYGVDKPANFESGTVVNQSYRDKMLEYRLSVSSGDSGSSICREDTGEIVGVVYGTNSRHTIGGSCIRARELIDSISPTTNYENGREAYGKVRVFPLLRGRLRGLLCR